MKKNSLEKVDWRKISPSPVIGVDEVGRGCLAGPVYAAAVILNELQEPQGLTDSKLLSESRRGELSLQIWQTSQVSIAFASVEEIDELNILQASLLAMHRAVKGLGVHSGHILVDGKFKIPDLPSFIQTPLIKGDLRAAPVSAAAIAAKVARDKLMIEMALEFPQYGFEAHKGYSTALHKERIRIHGPQKVHRKSFSGVKEHL